MGKKQKIILWIASTFCFLGAIVMFGWGTPFLIVAGLLLLPIEKIRAFLLDKMKIKVWTACILAGVMFVVGAIVSPSDAQSDLANSSSGGLEYSSFFGDEDSSSYSKPEKEDSHSSSFKENSTQSLSKPEKEESSLPEKEDSHSSSFKENSTQSSFKPEKEDSSVEIKVTYILNTSSKKIHYSTCRHVSKISPENKKTSTKSLAALIQEGYEKCGTCF